MPNLNRVFLMGNLTRDPELRYLPSNMPVVGIGLAVNRKWRNQQGEPQEETTFIDCEAFGKTAELINQYMRKGRPLFVEGRLRLDQWQDREGQNRSKLKVIVENFQFIDSRGGGEGGPPPNSYAAGAAPSSYGSGSNPNAWGQSQAAGAQQGYPPHPDPNVVPSPLNPTPAGPEGVSATAPGGAAPHEPIKEDDIPF